MPFQALLLRQLLLVQRLHQARGNPVPFQELQRYLLDETTVGDFRKSYSKKTFERDGNVIAEIFGVTIRSRRNKGYYLAAETDEALTDTHQRLLEAFELQNFLRLPQALAGYVQTEPRRPRGLEHLWAVAAGGASRAPRGVSTTRKHWQDAPQPYTAGPLLLREFRGRWYVLAVRPDTDDRLACFGLDRIRGLRATSQPFAPPPHFGRGHLLPARLRHHPPRRRHRAAGKSGCASPRSRAATCWATPCTPRSSYCRTTRPAPWFPSPSTTTTTCAWSCSATALR